MKISCYSLNIKNIVLFFMFALLFSSCEEEEPVEKIDYLKLYNEPKYPQKAEGRFLKSIDYQLPDLPLEAGRKVEFFYNTKNYVDYFKIYSTETDTVGRVVKIEYNINGLVSRIKYFNPDSVITSFELFEYNGQRQITRFSKYELAADMVKYELASFNKFSYGTDGKLPKIDELRYEKSRNFDRPMKDTYLYNDKGNVREKLNYEYDTKIPYSSTEYFYKDTTDFIYSDKKRPYENLGLPLYKTSYDEFQLSEIFSVNQLIGFQNYTYENSGEKIKAGEAQYHQMKYDSLNYPISKDGNIFYNYVDLK